MLSVNVDPRQLEMDELRQKLVGAYDAPAGYNPDIAGQITQRMRELMTQLRANESAIDLEAMKAMYLQGLGSKAICRKLFVSREFVLEHIKRWRLEENLRPERDGLKLPKLFVEERRSRNNNPEGKNRFSAMYGMVNADHVATAIVTVCRTTGVDPVEVASGKISHAPKCAMLPRSRYMAFCALEYVFPTYPKRALARMVGVKDSYAGPYAHLWGSKKKTGWYDPALVTYAAEAVRRVTS